MGTQNRLENGRGAWIALCAHATDTDTEGCETWSFTLREKNRLRVSESKVLRKHMHRRGMK
jgi:hypothetical protein